MHGIQTGSKCSFSRSVLEKNHWKFNLDIQNNLVIHYTNLVSRMLLGKVGFKWVGELPKGNARKCLFVGKRKLA